MPAANPALSELTAQAIVALGAAIRAQRVALGISSVAAAEAAGVSRVTLHRIEKGIPSVTAGAYAAVLGALGMRLGVLAGDDPPRQQDAARRGWLPARVRLADYPKLRELAWQVHGTPELTPREALDIYERNARHIEPGSLAPAEQNLIEALRQALGADGGV